MMDSVFAAKGTETQFVKLKACGVAGIPIPAERPTAQKPETPGLCAPAHSDLHEEVGPEETRTSSRRRTPPRRTSPLGIRPDHISMCDANAAHALSATVDVTELMGATIHMHVKRRR